MNRSRCVAHRVSSSMTIERPPTEQPVPASASSPRIVLASGSPRRRELLEQAGCTFEVIPSPADEIHDASLAPPALCEWNARLKAAAVAANHPDAWVIGADTLVFLDGRPLGKPRDFTEAASMLRALSGRAHVVCTGVCVIAPGAAGPHTFHEMTRVFFRQLGDREIEDYLTLVNPLDKAGGYAIQQHGGRIIERIDGPFDNVMGLPVAAVLAALPAR